MISRLISYLKTLIFLSAFTLLISGCSSSRKIPVKDLLEIASKPFKNWTVEDCNDIINSHTISNIDKYISGSIAYEVSDYDVFVSAMPLTDITIKAMAKKEALLKRLPETDFRLILNDYFDIYTNYKYDFSTNSLIKKNIPADSLKGFTFQVVFRNNTDPYRPIILDRGYEYFFLENTEGDYARVVEISGRYAETDFYLTDYLIVNITFDSHTDNGNLLFNDILSAKEFKLVFNGINTDPVELEWKMLDKKGVL